MNFRLQFAYFQHLPRPHLLQKQASNQGFTLLELLVVIVIMGLLSAIALPSFLNLASKAREAEAKTYVTSINRSQQSYFLQTNTFGDLNSLGIAISTSKNYTYDSFPAGNGINAAAITTATPAATVVRGYAGRVWVGLLSSGNASTFTIVCEGEQGSVPDIVGTECP